MDFYTITLTGLVLANAGLLYRSHRHQKSGGSILTSFGRTLRNVVSLFGISRGKTELGLEYTFLPVYVLVIASDWLQVRWNPSRLRVRTLNRTNQTPGPLPLRTIQTNTRIARKHRCRALFNWIYFRCYQCDVHRQPC